MGMISAVLAQAFFIGGDAYRRGRRALRGQGQMRVAAHAMVESARSAEPGAGRILLTTAAGASSAHMIRQSRSGIEENGFFLQPPGRLVFRRQWPASGEPGEGGVFIPLASGVDRFSAVLVRDDRRGISQWPPRGESGDTPPRLMEFRIRDASGGEYESAGFLRIDPESLTAVSAAGTDT
ncbi:MAG: hypothetical protein A3G34_05655 [Candidatus Lindowbacteria bacterium RIFCSPLOWO2_12_FULL_62_27]|nr:MAG: hypothetical protein A3I06_13505 [Candidatus Lindowbacteria bacterium RIFCSPLOWO2_02_FULL_62_12]OGH59906.1 MAG: hypothetical protein A3G34_05655 [Candidatus Lindowbacteria bacterium RIFCSPLOWO2_12_FULL_62_27]